MKRCETCTNYKPVEERKLYVIYDRRNGKVLSCDEELPRSTSEDIKPGLVFVPMEQTLFSEEKLNRIRSGECVYIDDEEPEEETMTIKIPGTASLFRQLIQSYIKKPNKNK